DRGTFNMDRNFSTKVATPWVPRLFLGSSQRVPVVARQPAANREGLGSLDDELLGGHVRVLVEPGGDRVGHANRAPVLGSQATGGVARTHHQRVGRARG